MQTTASTSARRKCRVFLVSMPPPEAEFEGQELMPMLMTIPTKSPLSTQRFLELPHGATIHRAGPTSSAAVLFVCAGPCSRPRGSPLGFSARRCSPVSVPALTACSNPYTHFFCMCFCAPLARMWWAEATPACPVGKSRARSLHGRPWLRFAIICIVVMLPW